MKKIIVVCMFGLITVRAFGQADSDSDKVVNDATELFNATKIVCSGLSDEISKVSNISKINTAVTGVGTVAAGGALATGIAKKTIDSDIDKLMQDLCEIGGCDAERIRHMKDEEIPELADILVQIKKLNDEIAKEQQKSKNLGNWRTGLMAGTIGTNLASAIISGVNANQSDLIQHIEACNKMIKSLSDMPAKLTSVGVSPLDNPIAKKINNVKTWCNQINVSDAQKIENRMKGVMGTSIAGVVVGGIGTAASASSNSDKYMNAEKRIALTESERQSANNLNTTANIMSGVNVGTGLVETGVNISLITLTKKMIRQAEMCEEALQ